jgi:anti-sigma regulatory factor (Ser/Thr protein kinase)
VSFALITGTTTIVAIDTHPRPLGSLRIEVEATADRLSDIRHQLNGWLEPIGMSETNIADIVLVVNEACTNCIEHAYRNTAPGILRIEGDVDGRRIDICIADSGVWKPPPRHSTTRGRGLPIMQAVSEQVEVDHTDTGTTVRLTFDADAPPRL